MTGPEFQAIRKRLSLSTVEMGRALGYLEGTDVSVGVTIRRFEAGLRPIPPAVERLALMYDRHGLLGEKPCWPNPSSI